MSVGGRVAAHMFEKLFRRAPFTRFALAGIGDLRLALHAQNDPWISGVISRGEVFDPHVTRLLSVALSKGDTVVDVGANIGWFTVICSRLVGENGRILAFEPEPRNLRILRRNVQMNSCDNVEIHPVALGERASRSILFRSLDNQGDHQLCVTADRNDGVDVRVQSADTLLHGRPVDWIKIDTQGSEVSILRGMQRVLAHEPGLVIEFWPYGLQRCGASAEELIGLLPVRANWWLIRGDGYTEAVTAARLLELSQTTYAPETMAHADLAIVPQQAANVRRYLEAGA